MNLLHCCNDNIGCEDPSSSSLLTRRPITPRPFLPLAYIYINVYLSSSWAAVEQVVHFVCQLAMVSVCVIEKIAAKIVLCSSVFVRIRLMIDDHNHWIEPSAIVNCAICNCVGIFSTVCDGMFWYDIRCGSMSHVARTNDHSIQCNRTRQLLSSFLCVSCL